MNKFHFYKQVIFFKNCKQLIKIIQNILRKMNNLTVIYTFRLSA